MAVKYGRTRKIPRTPQVEIHVRELTLGDTMRSLDYIEIREYIKSGEVYGTGIVIPKEVAGQVAEAILGFND